jgi:hypothetical protein
MKLTTHLHLVSRLRMYGVIPPLPHASTWHGAKLSTRTTLPLPLSWGSIVLTIKKVPHVLKVSLVPWLRISSVYHNKSVWQLQFLIVELCNDKRHVLIKSNISALRKLLIWYNGSPNEFLLWTVCVDSTLMHLWFLFWVTVTFFLHSHIQIGGTGGTVARAWSWPLRLMHGALPPLTHVFSWCSA